MSSSVPGNISYMLTLIAKNIIMKMGLSREHIEAIATGSPVPLPDFTILDVGCGYGKWGFLIRDTFDVMLAQNFNKPDWKIRLTAIEPFDKCITDIQRDIYNEIIQKDIWEVIDELGQYDLVLMGDVIEHFEKEEAHRLLKGLFQHSGNILISTPLGMMPQGAWAGNEREVHRSGWELVDFKEYTVVEHKIIQDEFTGELLKGMNIPKIGLLVLWLRQESSA